MSELIDGLDSEQLGMLADKVEALPEEQRNLLLPRLIAHWTKKDPEGATKWIEPRVLLYANEEWFRGFPTPERDLVEGWLNRAPGFAVELARRHPDKGLVASILSDAIRRGPDKDRGRRFEILRALPAGQERQKAIITYCFEWARTDSAAALAAAKTLPEGAERDGALREILAQWAGKDPDAAFEHAKTLGLASPGLLALMLKEAAKFQPAVAAEWLAKNAPDSVQQLGGLVLQRWAERDPVTAFQWAQDNGFSLTESLRNSAKAIPDDASGAHRFEVTWGSVLTTAMSKNPKATVEWIQSLPAGPERERYAELAVIYGQDPQVTLPLLAQLTGEAGEFATRTLAVRLYGRNPSEARDWAESLPPGENRLAAWTAIGSRRTEPLDIPPGPDRDAMYSGIATGQYWGAPVKSLERALQIANPELRRRTFDDVMALITRGDTQIDPMARVQGVPVASQQKVQEWLTTADVPEDWKQRWRRSLP